MKHFYAKMYRVQHALQIIDLELKVISKVIKTQNVKQTVELRLHYMKMPKRQCCQQKQQINQSVNGSINQ